MGELPSAIDSLATRRLYPGGGLLFRADEPAKEFFHIVSGAVRVYKTDAQGRELEVARFGPGEFLGEAVALAGGRYPFTAEAVKETHVLSFNAAGVLSAVETHPGTGRFFVDLLARKCLLLSGRLESLGLRTVRQRLARFLCASSTEQRPSVVRLKVKKGELARFLGAAGETLSRTLRQMQEDGVIEVRGASILIKDYDRLRSEAGE